MFFVTPAYAQAAGGAAANGAEILMQMAPFGIILLIMYLLILRPQQQRAKQHEKMVQAIRRGDTVITTGGLVGRVSKVTDDAEIEIEIAPNVRVRQLRGGISEVRSKGEPVKGEPAKAEPAKVEPAKTNQGKKFGKNQPAKSEPAKPEPAKPEPASSATRRGRTGRKRAGLRRDSQRQGLKVLTDHAAVPPLENPPHPRRDADRHPDLRSQHDRRRPTGKNSPR